MCSNAKDLNTPVLIRTYTHKDIVSYLSLRNCKIWEAARATSAATTFFEDINIGGQYFVDGATGMNNPVEHVLEEAEILWPGASTHCLVSIGTGVPELKDFGDNLVEVVKTLTDIATNTEIVHEGFLKTCPYRRLEGRYFRFNVQHGLENVELDESQRKGTIISATTRYLNKVDVKQSLISFKRLLPPTGCE